jgi:hypothetical protein
MRREPEFAGFGSKGVDVDAKLSGGVGEPDGVFQGSDEVIESYGGHSWVLGVAQGSWSPTARVVSTPFPLLS